MAAPASATHFLFAVAAGVKMSLGKFVLLKLAAGGAGWYVLAAAPAEPALSYGGYVGVGLAIGTAVGTAGASVVAALGIHFYKPRLEAHSWRDRYERAEREKAEARAAIEDNRREIEAVMNRLRAVETDRDGLVAQLSTLGKQLSGAMADNLRLSHNLLVLSGRQKPGAPFDQTKILVGDEPPAEPTGPRVLVVEDNPQSLEADCHLLRLGNFRVKAVTDLAEAMESLDSFAPDFVILDLMLPGGDGADLLREVRARGLATKVIVTTGKAWDQLHDVRALMPDLLLRKPFDYPNDVLPLLMGGA